MSRAGSIDNRKVAVHGQLRQALDALVALGLTGRRLVEAGEALEALTRALKAVENAAALAEPSRAVWDDEKGRHEKVHRDGLPAPVKARLRRLADKVREAMQAVKDVPETPVEAAAQRVKRARARAERREKR